MKSKTEKWAIRIYTTGGWYAGQWEDYSWHYTKKEAAAALPKITSELQGTSGHAKIVKL